MAAIITDKLKKQVLESIITDIDSSDNNYYIGIGRSEVWDGTDTAPTPENTLREVRNLGFSLQSMKTVADKTFVVPRYNWSSGSIYSGFNDDQAGHPNQTYYVFTDENHVYICLQPGRNAAGASAISTVKPTGTAAGAFKTSDGYVWKFLYSLGALTVSKFLAANFMPVTKILSTDGNSSASEVEQFGIQNAAVPGQLLGYTVTNGGSGYTSSPAVTIAGDGTGAKAVATIAGNILTKVEVLESDNTMVFGSGYSYADITITGGGGTNAAVRPIFGPKAGIGADPRDDLRSRALMFNAKPDGTESGDFIVGNDFRQIGLIKNPKMHADSDFTAETGIALPYLLFDLSTITAAFTADNVIIGGTSGAKAYVDSFDSDKIYYHQTEDTGFLAFQENEPVTEQGSGAGAGTLISASYDTDTRAFTYSDVDQNSGDVLFIDNRAAVTRSANAAEDIKIVIQI